MNHQTFRNINHILARDSKSTTYKFALLRGTIELIGENSPYIKIEDQRAHFPLGLLIEKWLLYYYPLVLVPQINGSAQLAFAETLRELVNYYNLRGGISAFYNDLKNKGIPADIQKVFLLLVKKIASTITQMPMKYIGTSIDGQHFGIYQYDRVKTRSVGAIDAEYLILNFGTFSIPQDYYEAFQLLGSFINGTDAILFKWAEFSVRASGQKLSVTDVLTEVMQSPVTARDIAESKTLYQSILQTEGKVRCVWSGVPVVRYDIDHIIPFSVWKNNDLWNLLPARPDLNNQKRDKIPSPNFIEQRRDEITHYWSLIRRHKMHRFEKELQISLLGYQTKNDWSKLAIEQLQKSCDYLITTRGFEAWTL
ncbi:HNH endonuclease domain-containing protein [Mucilaginibacter terrae]|uniref:HNH nuclease domain-containing protein n=1 Tax=Mucilaginibacter terrae TaxID=1955052 RepID=A0ABU3GR51_9SPHI|nr:HNH endonuclease domain-containing protein [Mucilaginibacter terrae]MDT3402263.1 hypothetical protein [Mucilaginibacter terrae]